MTIFAESPWPAIALCVAIELVFGFIFVRTGRALAVVGMVLALAGTVALVVVEQIVVTETEEVEDTLHGIAEALDANDTAAVLAAFAPECTQRGRVESELGDVTVNSATVGGDLEVRINQLTIPPSATAYFTGRINAQVKRGGTLPYENYIRKFKVTFERRGPRWLIANVEDADVRSQGF
ncbi:MAG: hypothetical protein DWQ37_23590 [Planctomycetota bacterium]|nr:MAG: hypothetical protein DWQ37_23590 [Planctomycetota bacterium]